MFLKKEKDPTSKQFDDDWWIRSPTEAQEVSTDVPEDSITCDQEEADPRKSSAHSEGSVPAEVCLTTTASRSAKEKLLPWRRRCARSELVPQAALRLWSCFHQLICDELMTGSLSEPLWPESKSMRKIASG